VYFKFKQNPSLKKELLSTGNLEMIEAATSDIRWDIRYNAKKAMQVLKSSWGSNWLGQVLMVVRDRIRHEEM